MQGADVHADTFLSANVDEFGVLIPKTGIPCSKFCIQLKKPGKRGRKDVDVREETRE
jgi:hypothetical protein